MRGSIISVIVLIGLILAIDVYLFQGIKFLTANSALWYKRIVYLFYFSITAFVITTALMFIYQGHAGWSRGFRILVFSVWSTAFIFKLFFLFFMLLDEIQRIVRWTVQMTSGLFSKNEQQEPVKDISRSDFLLKAGLVVASVPLVGMSYGVISGAYDYRIRRKSIVLNNLPSAFHGIKIVQLSDIHSGSFYNQTAVQGGIDLVMKENPDVIFFTGDLVNNEAGEMTEYFDIFKKLRAPLGIYSTLGNHDYGDYMQWSSIEAKRNNLQRLIHIHRMMGWNILLNENRIIETSGEKLAVIGVENWGKGDRWPKYGNLVQAKKGTEEIPVKLLLSHDPSHWDAQVRSHKDIDVTFSGHTHGFQFGVEIGDFKWSPVQYVYDQWAGLYQKENQYLYVNRGYGFIGFPGRIGIPPEITVIELLKA